MGEETGGVTGQAQGESIFLRSIHQIPMLSLLSWGECWLVPLLQSPENQVSLKGKGIVPVALPVLFSGEGPPVPYPHP